MVSNRDFVIKVLNTKKIQITKGKTMKNVWDRCLLGLVVCIGLGLAGFNVVLVVAQCPDEKPEIFPCTSDTCLPGCPIWPEVDIDGKVSCQGTDGGAVAWGNFTTISVPNSNKQAIKTNKLAPCTQIVQASDCIVTIITDGEVACVVCTAMGGTTMYEEVEYEEEDCGILA